MNSFVTSTGDRVPKKTIDSRTSRAKAEKKKEHLENFGYFFCRTCGRSDKPFYDPAHIISVDQCQKTGRAELCWSLENLIIECRDCHEIRDKLYISKLT